MIELFGERVLGLLNERGMTQHELAEAIDVTEVTISRYMTRRREPKATTVMKIAEFFGVTTDYLLRGIQCSDCTRRKFYMDGYEAGQREMRDELLDYLSMSIDRIPDRWSGNDGYHFAYTDALMTVMGYLMRIGVKE